jgi:excisionase family DNA binding protein
VNDAPAKLLLTAREAAHALAISTRLLWTLTNCGKLPAVRLGRCVRYDPADLARFVQSAKKGGAS